MVAGEKRIVVIESGFVMLGVITGITDTDYEMAEGQVIRNFGTTDGLAEIAIGGPLPGTRLDAACLVSIRKDKVLFSLLCQK